MTITIRKGIVTDVVSALELIKELAEYEKRPNEVEVTIEEMEQLGFGVEKSFEFYVAEIDYLVVGIALFYYKYSTWKGRCLFLEDIVITEPLRRKGIGKLLFNKVIEEAKVNKVKRMEWQVLNWNTPAINFYKNYHSTLDNEWVNCKLTNFDLKKF